MVKKKVRRKKKMKHKKYRGSNGNGSVFIDTTSDNKSLVSPVFNVSVDDSCIKDGKCPHATGKTRVVLSLKTQGKIKTLCETIPELEWFSIMTGKKREDETYYCDDIVILEQVVTGASCDLTDMAIPMMHSIPNIIGWLHSHAKMYNVEPSSLDVEMSKSFTGNCGLTIVTNNEGKFGGFSRAEKLPCGTIMQKEIEVLVEIIRDSAFVDEIKSKIKQRKIPNLGDFLGDFVEYESNLTQFQREALGYSKFDYCSVCTSEIKTSFIICAVCKEHVHKFCFDNKLNMCHKCRDKPKSNFDTGLNKIDRPDWENKGFVDYGYT